MPCPRASMIIMATITTTARGITIMSMAAIIITTTMRLIATTAETTWRG